MIKWFYVVAHWKVLVYRPPKRAKFPHFFWSVVVLKRGQSMINQINGCLQNESAGMGQFLDKMQAKTNYLGPTDLKDVDCLQKGEFKYPRPFSGCD